VEDARRRAKAVRNDADFAEYAIRTAPDYALTIKAVAQRIKKTMPCTEGIVRVLASDAKIMILDQGFAIHVEVFEGLAQQLLERISRYHQKEPASPGMDSELCQTESKLPKQVFRKLLYVLEARSKVRIVEGRVCLASHNIRFDAESEKRLQRVEFLFRQRMFSPPDKTEVMQLCGLNAKEAADTMRLLTEHGRLIRVAGDMYFHVDALEKARQLVVDHIKKEKRMESVQFKYLIDATRKYALPLLDYLDRAGITKRSPDNTRFLGPKA
jgi:selenocysteine-specific elongation factor